MPDPAATPPSAGLIVALDGPASSGKSSVGAAAAEQLGYRFCDTGLFYRAVTWLALRRGIPAEDAAGLAGLAGEVEIEADEAGRLARVCLGGEDVTGAIRGPEVDAAVSGISRVPELRAALLARQRRIAAAGRIVMAGRDIGTVVLPDAHLKLYLDATVEERARRRTQERGIGAGDPDATEILEALRRRDEIDRTRPVAPLRAAPDAIHLRTDGNALATTVGLVVEAIRRREAELASGDVPRTEPATGVVPRTEPATGGDPPAEPVPLRAAAAKPRHRRPVEPTPIATRLNVVITVGSFVMRVLARLLTRVRIVGDVGAIPRTGAVIVVANHASNADPVLIGGFLNPRIGRPMNWLGKREVFDVPGLAWLARHGGVHPVERGAADVEAFKTAMRILDAGHILAVFPEGTRSPDGRLQAAKDGVTVLASRSGAIVVPIGVGDSDRLWPKGRRLPRFTPSVSITIGEPFRLDEALAGADPGAALDRRHAKEAGTDLIMRRIAALLPPRQRGFYGDPPPNG
ncbi:MAG TPA: (d)CMP kinase [Candidatus Sulfomarinibacteraceae bacterium]|nr:(d)CMP kinase [Candidatus Sulfomarinibacteraceae bacterium]